MAYAKPLQRKKEKTEKITGEGDQISLLIFDWSTITF